MAETLEQRALRKAREREERQKAAYRAMHALQKDSDRSVALVGAALIDAELEAALYRFIIPTEASEKAAQKAFGSNGAMSSFSAKIDLGLMFGVYEQPVADDLHTIRKIRNEFAHDLDAHDFTLKPVADYVRRLKHITNFIEAGDGRHQLAQPYPGGAVFTVNLSDEDLSGRKFFLQSIIFFWGALWSAAPLGPHPVLNWKPPETTSP